MAPTTRPASSRAPRARAAAKKSAPKNEAEARRTYGDVSVEEIVEAALHLMEDGGLAKLSMRKLAEKLGLSPMAPYYYIGNKDALLDRMVDTVIEPVRVPGEGPWDERVRSAVHQTRRAIARYPELARVMQQRAPSAEQKRLAMETMAVFRESGLPQPMATSVSHVLLDYIFGSLSRQALALAGGTTTEDLLEAEFAFGVDLILAGVTSSVMPAKTRRTRTTPPRQKR